MRGGGVFNIPATWGLHPRLLHVVPPALKSKIVSITGGDDAPEQIVGDLLDAFVYTLLSDPMPRWIDMTRRAGKTVGPPDGGGIEYDAVFGTVVDRRGIAAHLLSLDECIPCGDDIHAGQIHGGRAVPLPADEAFD